MEGSMFRLEAWYLNHLRYLVPQKMYAIKIFLTMSISYSQQINVFYNVSKHVTILIIRKRYLEMWSQHTVGKY
jgi:hypothetical protein